MSSNPTKDPDDAQAHAEEHLEDAPADLRALFHATREMVRRVAPELEERHQNGRPCFVGGAPVATVELRRDCVHLCLFEGGRLSDPRRLLHGTGATLRWVALRERGQVDDDAVHELVRAAVRFDESG